MPFRLREQGVTAHRKRRAERACSQNQAVTDGRRAALPSGGRRGVGDVRVARGARDAGFRSYCDLSVCRRRRPGTPGANLGCHHSGGQINCRIRRATNTMDAKAKIAGTNRGAKAENILVGGAVVRFPG